MKSKLKPFDKVVVRNDEDEMWCVDIFSHIAGRWFVCIGGLWDVCIPYSKETQHLIGSTDNYIVK